MFQIQKISRFFFALFFVGISQIAIAQKVTLESGNLIAVDGEAICQFTTDKYSIYLFNFSQKGVDIFNSRGETYKSVKGVLRVYFSDLAIQVINTSDAWPKHLREVPNSMQEVGSTSEVTSNVGVVVRQDDQSGLKAKDGIGQSSRVLSRAEKKQNLVNFSGTTGFKVETRIQVYNGLTESTLMNFRYPDLSLIPLKERMYYQLAAKTLLRAGWGLCDSCTNILTLTKNIDDGTTKEYSYTMPQYGQVTNSSGTTNSQITVNPYTNSAKVTTTTVPKTSFGIVGYNTTSGTTTEFKREITVSIVDEISQVENYRYELTSTGSINDLNRVAPLMFAAIPIIHNKVDLCCGIFHNWTTQYSFNCIIGSESVYGKDFTW